MPRNEELESLMVRYQQGDPAAVTALVEHARRMRLKRLAVERFDGEPVAETVVMPLLQEAGFLAGPRRAVLRP